MRTTPLDGPTPGGPASALHGKGGSLPWAGRRRWAWPHQRSTPAGSIFLDDLGLGHDHLLAAVVAVGGDVVAPVGLARGRVGRQLLRGQGVMGAAHAAAGRGNAGSSEARRVGKECVSTCRSGWA